MPNLAPVPRTVARLGLLAATVLLASCQVVGGVTDALRLGFSTYQEPPEGQPHALLRVAADGNVIAFPASACQSASVPGSGIALAMERLQVGSAGLNGQQRGLPGPRPANMPFAEFRVPAGVPVTLGYGYSWREGSYDHNCQKVVSFTPAAGKAYEFVATTVTQARLCGVRVVRLDAPSEPLPLQDAPRCKG